MGKRILLLIASVFIAGASAHQVVKAGSEPPAKGAADIASPGHSQDINKIVAFGDSFTDNGHVDGHGFNRDTNGKVWVEYLSDMLNCDNLDNRAWGGARTDSGHFAGLDWSGFNWQVENYSMTSEPAKTLYTIRIGINDYWDAKDDPARSVSNI